MEPVDPAPNPPEDRIVPIAPVVLVAPEDPVVVDKSYPAQYQVFDNRD